MSKISSIGGIKKRRINFIYHKSPKIDLALIPIKLDFKKDDILLTEISFSLDVNELMETDDIFYISFQPGISSIKLDGNINPIIRKGIISRMNNDKTYHIDGFAFPGNSGSPVFMLPKYFRENEKGVLMGGDNNSGKIIGIINSYIPYKDVAISKQTGRERVIFEENTGLSQVSSINLIKEIVKQENFIKQEKKILKLTK